MSGWRLSEMEKVHRNNNKRRRREDGEDVRDEFIVIQLQTKLEEVIFNDKWASMNSVTMIIRFLP